jgi:hypothetical protein
MYNKIVKEFVGLINTVPIRQALHEYVENGAWF